MLARNSDLKGVIQSMREVEDRFNSKFNYPWVLLNEEPFTPEFKKSVLPSFPLPSPPQVLTINFMQI